MKNLNYAPLFVFSHEEKKLRPPYVLPPAATNSHPSDIIIMLYFRYRPPLTHNHRKHLSTVLLVFYSMQLTLSCSFSGSENSAPDLRQRHIGDLKTSKMIRFCNPFQILISSTIVTILVSSVSYDFMEIDLWFLIFRFLKFEFEIMDHGRVRNGVACSPDFSVAVSFVVVYDSEESRGRKCVGVLRSSEIVMVSNLTFH